MEIDEKRPNNLLMENAKIRFRNFRGAETQYNKAGTKSFCVLIEDASLAQTLAADGWNVRILKPRNEDEEPAHYISVTVRFDILPPKVILVTRKKKTRLDENSIACLDSAEIRNVDLEIRPRVWEVNGQSGVKAYLKTMYVTIEEDSFADKYADEESPEEDDYLPFN